MRRIQDFLTRHKSIALAQSDIRIVVARVASSILKKDILPEQVVVRGRRIHLTLSVVERSELTLRKDEILNVLKNETGKTLVLD